MDSRVDRAHSLPTPQPFGALAAERSDLGSHCRAVGGAVDSRWVLGYALCLAVATPQGESEDGHDKEAESSDGVGQAGDPG